MRSTDELQDERERRPVIAVAASSGAQADLGAMPENIVPISVAISLTLVSGLGSTLIGMVSDSRSPLSSRGTTLTPANAAIVSAIMLFTGLGGYLLCPP